MKCKSLTLIEGHWQPVNMVGYHPGDSWAFCL